MARSSAPRSVRRALAALLFLPVLASCAAPASTAAASTTPAAVGSVADAGTMAPAAATAPGATTVDAAALLAEVAAAAGAGSIDVVVLDAAGTVLVAGAGADVPVATASLVKLFLAQQLLAADRAGELTLDDDDLTLLEPAVTASDDEAMSTLWTRFDGAALVAAAAAEFGLTGTAPPAEAGQWGGTTTTAADYATFLAGLDDALAADDLATLTSWMAATTPTAADGFDQTFGLLSADAGTVGAVAAKQGWMCCVDSRRQLHSAGVLADGRVVVLLGDFPTSTGWAEARAAIDAAARAVVTATA